VTPPRPAPRQGVPFDPIGSDRDRVCRYCRAGSVLGFDWEYAKTLPPESRPLLLSFVPALPLRRGTLDRCKHCDQPWYFDDETRGMSRVSRDRVPLIEAWGRHPIVLASEHLAELRKIGRTPPRWGLELRQEHQFPCAITTTSGEHFDRAIVSFQRHPPLEDRRNYRLGSEIVRVQPSPHAAPLAVRVAASQADEPHPGAIQTVFKAPDGSVIHLDETLNFRAGSVSAREVYFVADDIQTP
jgi:hypothetical protein